MSDVQPVPIHPEAVAGDPATVRWVIPPGTLAVRGEIVAAPGEFGDLVAGGVLTAVAEAGALLVRLVPSADDTSAPTWASIGPRVRTALGLALREPGAWRSSGERAPIHGPDAALAEATESVIAGEAGDYVRSHGGRIELVGVGDGCVDVRLTGACGHCPAASATLHHRVETALRAAYPDLVEVRQIA